MLLKNLKKIIVLMSLLVVILPVVYPQQECAASEIKDALRKALFDYFESPDNSKLSVNEIKDFLHYYISLDSNQLAVDCGGSGPLSGKPYYLMLGAARNIQKNIPTCSDGTQYGKCSSNLPNYCYGGKIVEKCKLCGCGENQECNKATNKCVPKTQSSDLCKLTTCDDRNPCTSDSCNNGVCSRELVANGTSCGHGQICQNGYCTIDPASSCERVNFYRPLNQNEPLLNLRENRKEFTNLQIFPNILILEDLDGDKDLDMIIHFWDFNTQTFYLDYWGYPSSIQTTFAKIFFNDGNGNFKDSGQSIVAGGKISVGDVDGDNDNDLAITVDLTGAGDYASNYSNSLQTYLNDGKGYFKPGQQITSDRNRDATLTDIDNDADLDLVFMNSTYGYLNPRTKIYLNDGRGAFTGAKDTGIIDGSVYDFVIFDIDNDGDKDLVEVHSGDYVYSNYSVSHYQKPILFVYGNDGKGKFSLVQKIEQPPPLIPAYPTSAYPIFYGDIDNDGDNDIIVKDNNQGYTTTPPTPVDRVYRNDGKGFFTLDSKRIYIGYPGFEASGPLADVDNDGDLDTYISGLFMLNDGTGSFVPYCSEGTSIAAFGDINSDGKTDYALITFERGIVVQTFLQK